jgi:hypothetical protein
MRIALALTIAAFAAPAAAATTGVSPSACAVAWNHWAPPRLHKIVADSSARAAFIAERASVGTDTWSRTGGSTSTSSLGCSIQFVLPDHRGVLAVWGPWRSGTIRAWRGPVRDRRSLPLPQNGRVRADGTVGFTG